MKRLRLTNDDVAAAVEVVMLLALIAVLGLLMGGFCLALFLDTVGLLPK